MNPVMRLISHVSNVIAIFDTCKVQCLVEINTLQSRIKAPALISAYLKFLQFQV